MLVLLGEPPRVGGLFPEAGAAARVLLVGGVCVLRAEEGGDLGTGLAVALLLETAGLARELGLGGGRFEGRGLVAGGLVDAVVAGGIIVFFESYSRFG